MIPKKKIGIYGGTFNPPHIAHVKACEAFSKTINPDKLLVIPDFLPPHKEIAGGAETCDRLEMTRLAFSELSNAVVSDMEITRGGRSYTAQTLRELSEEDTELFFLCGTDMLLSLDTWYRPDIIFSLATICYVRRENDEENDRKIPEKISLYKEKFNSRIVEIPIRVTELSSSRLRDMIKKGDDVSALLPVKVADYIRERGLYR